jgi:hypothetical protein
LVPSNSPPAASPAEALGPARAGGPRRRSRCVPRRQPLSMYASRNPARCWLRKLPEPKSAAPITSVQPACKATSRRWRTSARWQPLPRSAGIVAPPPRLATPSRVLSVGDGCGLARVACEKALAVGREPAPRSRHRRVTPLARPLEPVGERSHIVVEVVSGHVLDRDRRRGDTRLARWYTVENRLLEFALVRAPPPRAMLRLGS